MNTAEEYLPRPGEIDPLSEEPQADVEESSTMGPSLPVSPEAVALPGKPKSQPRPPVLRVFTLSEITGYQPPEGSFLVGDGVIELGEVALLYGPPGSFKGFAVGQLMAGGALGQGEWLGHQIKSQFPSLWLNCENGRRRLRDQFLKTPLPDDAEKFIHVTDIPEVWDLGDARLAGEIRRVIIEKNIRLLIVDTVSNFLEDEFAKQFATFFSSLNTLLHGLEPRPAVLLIHHSRKPKDGDKGARGLLNLISGHQTLQRRARSICYLGRVSDEFDEKRVAAVWLKVSNNGEAEGCKTALQLAPDLTLHPIPNFDWSQWHGATSGGAGQREPKINEQHIRQAFELGIGPLPIGQIAGRIQEITGVGRSAAYEALKTGAGGRFAHLLVRQPGTTLISLRPQEPDGE